jgi:hypothetical protein
VEVRCKGSGKLPEPQLNIGSREQRPKPSVTVAWSRIAFNIDNPSFRALNALYGETRIGPSGLLVAGFLYAMPPLTRWQNNMNNKPVSKKIGLLLLSLAGIILLLGILLNVGPSYMAGTMQRDIDNIAWSARTPGETAYLRLADDSDPGHTICLAPTPGVYDKYVTALIAKDSVGAMMLTNQGLFCVGNGTQVKVLEISALLTRVRVVSGVNAADEDNIGMSGWTAKERVVQR